MCDLDGCGANRAMPPITISDGERRAFLKGALALPLATVLYDAALAEGAAATLTDVTIPFGAGKSLAGALALPAESKGPAVLLIHEWWGLNDQIKAVAAELARLGYVALAVNLYGVPAVTRPEDAQKLASGVDAGVATAGLVAAVGWLRGHERSTGKVGTIGWCFGGGWSLNVSLATPVDATVIYYGNVRKTVDEVKRLSGPVLGHFGTEDKNINKEMVGVFEKSLADAGKAAKATIYWYTADHAFANPTGGRYDAEDAKLAWERTLGFLKANLG
jgi:carboxymethylenebutenolidase